MDLSVDINIVLGMPWMANLGSILWNFASLEIWFQQGDRTVTFTVPSGRALQMVLALPVPVLIVATPAPPPQQQALPLQQL